MSETENVKQDEATAESDLMKLLACPFCGSIDVSMSYSVQNNVAQSKRYSAECGSCAAFGPEHPEKDLAKSLWNARAFKIMPNELTAENGAKALLIGEFLESYETTCPECGTDDFPGECECCDGSGRIVTKVPVSWTTIKEIYKKIYEHSGS
jgi:Lar family restriction alleviation protein